MKIKVLALFIGLFSLNLFAVSINVECDNCSNYPGAALSAPAPDIDVYQAHVYDLTKGKLHSYRIVRADGGSTRIVPISSPESYIYALDNLVMQKTLVASENTPTVPTDVIKSAWELYADNEVRKRFFDYINNNRSSYTAIFDAVNHFKGVFNVVNLNVDVPLYVLTAGGATIHFNLINLAVGPDGTVLATYEINWALSTDELDNPLNLNATGGGSNGDKKFPNVGEGSTLQYFFDALERAHYNQSWGDGAGGTVICQVKSDNTVICTLNRS